MALSVEEYARVLAEVCAASGAREATGRAGGAGPSPREEALRRSGLDEAAWKVEDDAWQRRLSAGLDEPGDGVADVVTAFSKAYEAAQRAQGAPLSLERFAEATRRLRGGGDLLAALAAAGVTVHELVRATEHWTPVLARDEGARARFEALLRGALI